MDLRRLFHALAPAVLLCAVFGALLAFSWGKWPDVLVDFGHELYVPWQLSEGKVLGRDVIMGATGSLSPYVNALAFSVFGVGLRTLVVLNLVLLAALTGLLFVMLRELWGRLGATVACTFFLAVFAFGQYVVAGNYNYVTPYSHGATHGMLLSLVAVALAWRHARTGALRDLALAGAALGLLLLTKPELFVAGTAALGVMAVLLLRQAPDGRRRATLGLALLLPALVAPLLSVLLLSAQADLDVALRATFAPFIAMATPITASPFYLEVLGVDDLWGNAARAGRWLAGYALLFGAAALLDLRVGAGPRRWVAPTAALAGLLAVAWKLMPPEAWLEVGRPLPLLVGLGALASLIAAWRAPRPFPPALLLRSGLAVFAALLLLKMLLNTRLYHYGFVLAMPATLLLVAWLVAAAPEALRDRGGSGLVFRSVALTGLALVAGAFLWQASLYFRNKQVAVGTGPDAFLADSRGRLVSAMLRALGDEPHPDTLAVIPEGAMINYLSRRVNPSPYLSYLPDALALWGEPTLLQRYRASPPALVVVVRRDATEHGATLFGRDYGIATLEWLQGSYVQVTQIGRSPFDAGGYGMLLLRHASGQ